MLTSTLLLIQRNTSESESKRQENKKENLHNVGGVWHWDINRACHAGAQQKGKQKRERSFERSKEQVVDPAERMRDGVELDAAEAGDGGTDEEDDGHRNATLLGLTAKVMGECIPATIGENSERKREDREDK